MKYWILILASFCCGAILAQQNSIGTKGATPLNEANTASAPKNTYAVVVGISDYQDPGIPDLRFADKDAEAFANYLRSPTGGSLAGDNLKVLTNTEATLGKFAIALDWLLERTKEGDQAIIYFSGHGDVEKKTLTQPGFLLCWDAPPRVYMAGGALALPMLQEVISTLSTQNKAKVLVITDACHSAKLAGSEIYGAQLTGQNLARQYANEIKLLSCQADEYSIEGEQWGGGRGAFSYYLVDALYGMADANNDLSVNLKEVGRYLEDHVTAEVAPVNQNPKFVGNPSEPLTTVDANLLASLRSGKTNQMKLLYPIQNKGIEDEVLATLDTSTLELYRLFQKSLKDKVFFSPNDGGGATACADAYFERLIAEPKLAPIHTSMKRNYAAAMQDDAQQTLNEWMKAGQNASLETANTNRIPQKLLTQKLRSYPRCLDRAAELLGSEHYFYKDLKARKYFFEGYLLANSNQNPNAELGERALELFRQSLSWRPEQPHVYWQMSNVFGYNFLNPDSLEHYTRRTLELYPNWTIPYTDAAYLFSLKFKDKDRAKTLLEKAIQIDSSSAVVLNHWGIYNLFNNNYFEAERQMKKSIAMDSTGTTYYNNIGLLYKLTHRYAEAEQSYKKALALDSSAIISWVNLGITYLYSYRYPEAEQVFKTALALDSTDAASWHCLGSSLYPTGRFMEEEFCFKKAISLDSTSSNSWANLGDVYIRSNRFAEAEPILKKAISLDSTNLVFWKNLQIVYTQTQQYAEAEPFLKKLISLDSLDATNYRALGTLYIKTNRPLEARLYFLKTIKLSPNAKFARIGLAAASFLQGKTTEAIAYLEEAIEQGVTLDQLNKDEDLAPLRALPEWKDLMKKHFPDKIKD